MVAGGGNEGGSDGVGGDGGNGGCGLSSEHGIPLSFGSPESGLHSHAEQTDEPFSTSKRLHHGSHAEECTLSS